MCRRCADGSKPLDCAAFGRPEETWVVRQGLRNVNGTWQEVRRTLRLARGGPGQRLAPRHRELLRPPWQVGARDRWRRGNRPGNRLPAPGEQSSRSRLGRAAGPVRRRRERPRRRHGCCSDRRRARRASGRATANVLINDAGYLGQAQAFEPGGGESRHLARAPDAAHLGHPAQKPLLGMQTRPVPVLARSGVPRAASWTSRAP